MKIVVAIDSFKGSLSSLKAGNAVKEGIKKVYNSAKVLVCPVADGGEGTVDALTSGLNGVKYTILVTGPLGDKVNAEYGIVNDTAIIEMSQAAGITLVDEKSRNPLNTTTYGVGEIIIDAVNKGIRKFIIGIGGSVTNDGGFGMLSALGYEFYNENDEYIPLGAKGLEALKYISDKNVNHLIKECSFSVACDVENPLLGINGCSHVYGPQKGATPDMIEKMDEWLKNFAVLSEKLTLKDFKDYPGSGAAGGMGFAFLTYLNAELKKGIDIVINHINFKELVKGSDFVITGEGRMDSQTVMGKVPVGIAKVAKEENIPVIAFCGSATDDSNECNKHGVDAIFPVLRSILTLNEALSEEIAYKNVVNTAEQVFGLINKVYKN